MSFITIDGSQGEGGGQILRTTLSLAALLGRPVEISNIRAGRRKPGLRPQHVQAVKAAAAICAAQVEGAKELSQTVRFEPQTPPQPGNYRFDIGSAGAATLVLQTLLLPLGQAATPSHISVRGGTHVAWSPPYDYLADVYLPALAPLGIQAESKLAAWGFYPRGGGEIRLQISPSSQSAFSPDGTATSAPWSQPRGDLTALHIRSAASNVGNQVTARQAKQAYNRLAAAGFQPQSKLLNPKSGGPGTCLFLLAEYESGGRAGFTGFGRRGYPAERVADDAVDAFLRYQASGCPVDPHLADQLILPLALSDRATAFETSEITAHLQTNIQIVERFLGPRFQLEGQPGQPGRVICSGSAN